MELSNEDYDEIIDSFDSVDGVARLASADAGFDGQVFSVTIQCFSAASAGPDRATEKVVVDIELWDKCRQSTITMPRMENTYTERFLYEETFYRFEKGVNSLGCGPIAHRLIGLPSETFTIVEPPEPLVLDIGTKASTPAELGVYDYVIQGCLYFPVDGLEICETTNDLQMEVKDPCAGTIPSTQPIKVLSAPRLKADGAFLDWPFTDSVDDATLSYGVDKCGIKSLKVYDASNDMPVPFLWFDADMAIIKLEPDLNSPLGLRDYYYEVTMLGYPSQFSRQPFQAEVTICEVDRVSSNGGFINDRQTMWGEDAITVDATDAVARFA